MEGTRDLNVWWPVWFRTAVFKPSRLVAITLLPTVMPVRASAEVRQAPCTKIAWRRSLTTKLAVTSK
jgi:hypothetical protein